MLAVTSPCPLCNRDLWTQAPGPRASDAKMGPAPLLTAASMPCTEQVSCNGHTS
jgi:hypothetical protein